MLRIKLLARALRRRLKKASSSMKEVKVQKSGDFLKYGWSPQHAAFKLKFPCASCLQEGIFCVFW